MYGMFSEEKDTVKQEIHHRKTSGSSIHPLNLFNLFQGHVVALKGHGATLATAV